MAEDGQIGDRAANVIEIPRSLELGERLHGERPDWVRRWRGENLGPTSGDLDRDAVLNVRFDAKNLKLEHGTRICLDSTDELDIWGGCLANGLGGKSEEGLRAVRPDEHNVKIRGTRPNAERKAPDWDNG